MGLDIALHLGFFSQNYQMWVESLLNKIETAETAIIHTKTEKQTTRSKLADRCS